MRTAVKPGRSSAFRAVHRTISSAIPAGTCAPITRFSVAAAPVAAPSARLHQRDDGVARARQARGQRSHAWAHAHHAHRYYYSLLLLTSLSPRASRRQHAAGRVHGERAHTPGGGRALRDCLGQSVYARVRRLPWRCWTRSPRRMPKRRPEQRLTQAKQQQ